jgi:pimeloyl-ACP methyl ester carboxylesterase
MTTSATDQTTAGQLYWEAAGSGSPVLLIGGTPGDAGQFDHLVSELVDDHLVITYDRRGTSRSRPAPGWQATSVAEQAADATEVLAAVGVPDALIYGTSNGAIVALELGLRHPNRVTGLMLHEPPLVTVLRDPEPVASATTALIGSAMEAGGPTAALDAFLRFAYGDTIVDAWPSELRERILSNAEMVFSVEMPAFQPYRPDERELARSDVRAAVFVGEEQQLSFFREAAEWLARHLDAEVRATPAAHGPQFSDPAGLADAIRTFALAA